MPVNAQAESDLGERSVGVVQDTRLAMFIPALACTTF